MSAATTKNDAMNTAATMIAIRIARFLKARSIAGLAAAAEQEAEESTDGERNQRRLQRVLLDLVLYRFGVALRLRPGFLAAGARFVQHVVTGVPHRLLHDIG